MMNSRISKSKNAGPESVFGVIGRAARWSLGQAPFVLFLAALLFLGFVGGAMITIAGIAPSDYFRDAYRAGKAAYEKHTRYHDPLATDLWAPERTPKHGVFLYDPSQAQQGLTLYTSGHAAAAFLIDMQGKVVHQWERPYSTVWDSSAAVREPVPDNRAALIKAHLYPNGDLLAIYIGVGDSPYGYGMVKLDRDSQLLWKNLDYFHHDFDIGPDGLIYGLTQNFRDRAPEGITHLEEPFMDDFLVVVSPEGRTLKKISLLEAVHRSDFNRLLWLVPSFSLGDPLHTNNVDILNDRTAAALRAKIPVAAAGQVLLSFRELAGGTIALLDLESAKVVWATRGSWFSQHDPDVLPSGNILLFDNRGHFGSGGQSRVVEVDPGSGAVLWQYTGDTGHPLQSFIRSDQQMLPNGNILITESDGGRLLEVSRAGDIIWEFTNPVRAGQKDKRIAIVSWAQRIAPQDLGADFRDWLGQTRMAREVVIP